MSSLRDELEEYDLKNDPKADELKRIIADSQLENYYFVCIITSGYKQYKLNLGHNHPYDSEFTKNIMVDSKKATLKPSFIDGEPIIEIERKTDSVAEAIGLVIKEWKLKFFCCKWMD